MTIFGKGLESIRDYFSKEDPQKYIDIPLGKYSEAVKSERQLKGIDDAESNFKANNWPQYILDCLDYIYDDKGLKGSYKNLEGDKWEFAGAHGSVIFKGQVNEEYVEVQAILLKVGTFKPSMLRQLLESSLDYEFISFALNDDNEIIIKIYLTKEELSPDLFFSALEQLCVTGDVYDSEISTNYPNVQWENQEQVIYDSPEICNYKYNFFKSELDLVRDFVNQEIRKSTQVDYVKISYRLLGYFYKMDYLVSPRNYLYGYNLDTINGYWASMNKSSNNFETGIEVLRKAIEELPDMSEEMFKYEAVNLPYLFTTREEFDFTKLQGNIKPHLNNLKGYHSQDDDVSTYWCIQLLLGFLIFHTDEDPNWTTWVCYLYATLDAAYIQQLGFLGDILIADGSAVNLDLMHEKLEEIVKTSQKSIRPLPPLPDKDKMKTPIETVYSILLAFE